MGNLIRKDDYQKSSTNKLRSLPFEKPTQRDYDFISHFSDLDQDEIKETIQTFLASHIDGRMNGIDFCSLYNTLRKEPKDLIDRISENIFRTLWFRSSGHDLISFREFLLMLALTSSKGALADKLNFAFYLYDLDQSNALETDKVKEIIHNILELFYDPKKLRDMNSFCNEVFRHLKINQIITKDNFLNGLIENKKFREMITPPTTEYKSLMDQ